MPRTITANDFDGDLSKFLHGYKYQPKLTRKLDALEGVSFTPDLLNEIVLWKVNRYVSLEGDQLHGIERLATLKPREHGRARLILEELLDAHGVDLPMASTFLRFRNPSVFQIIDRHAYRAIYGRDYKEYTKKPSKKIQVYFSYIDDLRCLCDAKRLCFETIDRVLYEFDKKTNGSLSKDKTGS
jgi:thermostable 8-oxoguanine DNA glycosylase